MFSKKAFVVYLVAMILSAVGVIALVSSAMPAVVTYVAGMLLFGTVLTAGIQMIFCMLNDVVEDWRQHTN